MMNIRLIFIVILLCMSVESIGARAIAACIQNCFNGTHTYRCCSPNEIDIAGDNGSVSQQSNSSYASPFRQKRSAWPTAYISHKIHDGFTAEEKTVISNALQVVVNRLFTPRVRNCMYDKTGNLGYHLADGVYARSNVDEDSNYDGYKDLLKFQLDCLEQKAVRQTFPVINIRPWHEQSNTVGQGTLGCVTIKSQGSKFITTGEFNMWLNRYHLAAPTTTGFDADYWAGVIVHEMLHNLGHSHGDYSDSWQINVFEKCLVQNGNYASGKRTSHSNYVYYIYYH